MVENADGVVGKILESHEKFSSSNPSKLSNSIFPQILTIFNPSIDFLKKLRITKVKFFREKRRKKHEI